MIHSKISLFVIIIAIVTASTAIFSETGCSCCEHNCTVVIQLYSCYNYCIPIKLCQCRIIPSEDKIIALGLYLGCLLMIWCFIFLIYPHVWFISVPVRCFCNRSIRKIFTLRECSSFFMVSVFLAS